MGRASLGIETFDAAVERLVGLYSDPMNRIVVSFSAGKDSGILLELAIIAARETGRLPVEVLMRDEEIMLPGTFEYAERMAEREEVDFHWIYARQPIVNAFNREMPFWWVFDPLLDPEEWVRQPPSFAYEVRDLNIEALITTERFPVPVDKIGDRVGDLYALIGLRAAESRNRMFGIYSSGGWLTKADDRWGYRKARPIYDWTDEDVWLAISKMGWDYNRAYDVMLRMGVSPRNLRIAPPTMRSAGLGLLKIAARAWPRWFDKVAKRCPGVRTAAQFGRVSVEPKRRFGEKWSETFQRECIEEAPDWIAERASFAAMKRQQRHRAHSSIPLPEVHACPRCPVGGSWELLTRGFYMGDPFSFNDKDLKQIEPEAFRPGSGTWAGGKATW